MKYLGRSISFSNPSGAPALTPAGGISWRVFSNPVALAIGGITAVLLELADPRVRHGVWDHSSFKDRPFERMSRTAKAAMITVYAPRADAVSMIEGVTRMHARVSGHTPGGAAYAASDPALLTWVHATASYGFLSAYDAFDTPLTPAEKDQFYIEAQPAAALYGAQHAPASQAGQVALFNAAQPGLEPSDILQDFLALTRKALPVPGRLADVIIEGAIDLLPEGFAAQIGVSDHTLSARGRATLARLARMAAATPLPGAPVTLACKRMGIKLSDVRRRGLKLEG